METDTGISLPVLVIIKTAQAQHGLRHGDYQRYRKYCARRLQRLRQSVDLKCGKKSFKPNPVTDEILKNNQHLSIPLMQAERCWAYAMQLRQESAKIHRKIHHSRARLRKAVQFAETLERLASDDSRVDARTALEAQAYSCYMSGVLSFELQDWENALKKLNKANDENFRKIWTQFAEAASISDKVYYTQRLEEMEANIRYCAYSLGDGGNLSDLMHMDNIDEVLLAKLDAALATQAQSLHQVKWRNRMIPVHSDKMRVAILRVQEKMQELTDALANDGDKNVFAVYDRMLMELRDAYSVYQDECKTAGKQKPPDELGTYLQAERLSQENKRHQRMIEHPENDRANKPEENVRLYDTIIQNLDTMSDLPGVSDQSDLVNSVNAERLVRISERCLELGRAYLAIGKYPEAMALFDRTMEHVGTATAVVASDQDMMKCLKDVARNARGGKCEVRARILESTITVANNGVSYKALAVSDHLDKFVEKDADSIVMARFPPALTPVPTKPFFFDLALSSMPVPDISGRVSQQGGGISGLLSGVFGWGQRS